MINLLIFSTRRVWDVWCCIKPIATSCDDLPICMVVPPYYDAIHGTTAQAIEDYGTADAAAFLATSPVHGSEFIPSIMDYYNDWWMVQNVRLLEPLLYYHTYPPPCLCVSSYIECIPIQLIYHSSFPMPYLSHPYQSLIWFNFVLFNASKHIKSQTFFYIISFVKHLKKLNQFCLICIYISDNMIGICMKRLCAMLLASDLQGNLLLSIQVISATFKKYTLTAVMRHHILQVILTCNWITRYYNIAWYYCMLYNSNNYSFKFVYKSRRYK